MIVRRPAIRIVCGCYLWSLVCNGKFQCVGFICLWG